jgi:potassium-dependent mechanosensitive channel
MDDILAPVAAATAAVEQLEKQLDRIKTTEDGLSQQRADVDALQQVIDKAAAAIQPRLEETRLQLEKLGAPPKEDQQEAPQIAAERTRLAAITAILDGATKSADLVKVRARQHTARVQELRHALFAKNLFQRANSPLLPGIWAQIGAAYEGAARQFGAVFGIWQSILAARLPVTLAVVGASVAAYLALCLITRRVLGKIMPEHLARRPSYSRRAAAAFVATLLFAAPGLAALGLLYVGFQSFDLIYSRIDGLTLDMFQSGAIFVSVTALANAIFAPL